MRLDDSLASAFAAEARQSTTAFEAARQRCGTDALLFAEMIVDKGWLAQDDVGQILGNRIDVAYLDLRSTVFQPEVVRLIPRAFAERFQTVAVYSFGDAVTVATTRPTDEDLLRSVARIVRKPVEPVFSLPRDIARAVQLQYASVEKAEQIASSLDVETLAKMHLGQAARAQPLREIIDAILTLALKERASDVHIEPGEFECRVRFRIDGSLCDRLSLPAELSSAVASRLEILGSCDIAERRGPHDGRFQFDSEGLAIDMRLSTQPVIHGEKVVIRVLGQQGGGVVHDLGRLDFAPETLLSLELALARPNGIIFVTGPTGSGKSTTLYAALAHLDRPEVNIATIEDPVECRVATINQTQADDKAGRTFNVILRAMLRQDPDVLLIGEIRDAETAEIASKAALTGHLVLSTLHTNNALQATTRLVHMGVAPYIVAPAIVGVLAQRLVRRLCEYCRVSYVPDSEALAEYFKPSMLAGTARFWRATGCHRCRGTGYHGRIGIYEYLEIDEVIREHILRDGGLHLMRNYVRSNGFRTMRFDGFVKAAQNRSAVTAAVITVATRSGQFGDNRVDDHRVPEPGAQACDARTTPMRAPRSVSHGASDVRHLDHDAVHSRDNESRPLRESCCRARSFCTTSRRLAGEA